MTTATAAMLAVVLPGPAWAWDLAISVVLAALVVTVLLALFREEGDIRVSDQRAAAIAAGEADRRTVFEFGLTKPFMWLMLAISHRFAAARLKAWLDRTLVAAGSPNYYTSEEYLALALAAGLVAAGVLEAGNVLVYGSLSAVLALFGVAAGMGLTFYGLYDQAQKRLRTISRRLPYALDLIALAMGAGATFIEAVRTVVREPRDLDGEREDDPFNVEFRTVLTEMDLGATRRRALENLSARVPLDTLRGIIASAIQAEQLGTPLGEVLHDQATLLRLRRSFAAENKAAVASVRILIPCLLLVIAVILAVFGPAIVHVSRGGLF
jgi:tight adherence protein C